MLRSLSDETCSKMPLIVSDEEEVNKVPAESWPLALRHGNEQAFPQPGEASSEA